MTDGPASGSTNVSQPGDDTPPDLHEVRITGSPETIAKVLREFELDVGCRHPHVDANADRSATLLAYATEARIRELETAGYKVERGRNMTALGRERQSEVGKGDRFEGGRKAPVGLGDKRKTGGARGA